MNKVKVAVSMTILLGFIMGFMADDASRQSVKTLAVISLCIYFFGLISRSEVKIHFDEFCDYSALDSYTQHVQIRQKRLFDHIAEKEHIDATD